MRQIHKLSIVIISALIMWTGINNNLYAQAQDVKTTGTAGYQFLLIPVNAKVAGMGEAAAGLTDLGSAAIFSNPGGLGFVQGEHSFSFSYSPWFADTKHSAVAYGFNGAGGVWGVSYNFFNYGTMERTVRRADQKVYEVLGTFTASSFAFGLTYSKQFTDKFSFGATFKYVKETIFDYGSSNLLFDGGIIYYTGFSSLRVAASVQNFGVNSKFRSDVFKMPGMLKLGLAGEVYGSDKEDIRVTVAADALHPTAGEERVVLGGEVAYKNTFYLRGGYKFFFDEETYSAGFGFRKQLPYAYGIDFAYSAYGRLGNITRISLDFAF